MEISRTEIMERLMALPVAIQQAEIKLFNNQHDVFLAKTDLQSAKDRLYVDGSIDGKNAEIREAQLRQRTTIEQNTVNTMVEYFERQKVELTKLQNELAALRAVADLFKGAA